MTDLNVSKDIMLTLDDCREGAKNAINVMGGTPRRGIHFLKPSVIHLERWMLAIRMPQRCIFCVKL